MTPHGLKGSLAYQERLLGDFPESRMRGNSKLHSSSASSAFGNAKIVQGRAKARLGIMKDSRTPSRCAILPRPSLCSFAKMGCLFCLQCFQSGQAPGMGS